MMDDNIIETMIRDKSEITAERLEEIRSEEIREEPGALEQAMEKVMTCLQSGVPLSFRDLRRKTRIKGSRLDRVLAELETENRVKIIEVKQRTGPAARMISLNRPTDNSPEARQKRINALAKSGGLYRTERYGN